MRQGNSQVGARLQASWGVAGKMRGGGIFCINTSPILSFFVFFIQSLLSLLISLSTVCGGFSLILEERSKLWWGENMYYTDSLTHARKCRSSFTYYLFLFFSNQRVWVEGDRRLLILVNCWFLVCGNELLFPVKRMYCLKRVQAPCSSAVRAFIL